MKMVVAILMAAGVAWASAQNQEKELAKDSDPAVTRATADSVAFQAKIMQRLFGVDLQVDGALPQAIKTGNALQLLNPFAPAEYGSGYDNVTTDPETGKATGMRFIGIRF